MPTEGELLFSSGSAEVYIQFSSENQGLAAQVADAVEERAAELLAKANAIRREAGLITE